MLIPIVNELMCILNRIGLPINKILLLKVKNIINPGFLHCRQILYHLSHQGSPKNIKQYQSLGFPGGASGKEPTCQFRRPKRHGSDPWVRKIPWRREWQTAPVFLAGESHGQRSLVGYSP